VINTEVAPAAVNPPMIFEPPSTLAGSQPQIWVAASAGPAGAFDPNWGGCFVWLSSDGATYQQVGEIDSAARMGALTAILASYGGANPDTSIRSPSISRKAPAGRSHSGRRRGFHNALRDQGRGRHARISELSRRDAHQRQPL
jgi:hypothetical protein